MEPGARRTTTIWMLQQRYILVQGLVSGCFKEWGQRVFYAKVYVSFQLVKRRMSRIEWDIETPFQLGCHLVICMLGPAIYFEQSIHAFAKHVFARFSVIKGHRVTRMLFEMV